MKSLYLIGSLRNPAVPAIAETLRNETTEIFDNWFSAGEIADDSWRDYERGRNHTYKQALAGHSGHHIYSFDRFHLNRCHGAILILPSGRSGHLEAGFVAGQGKPVFLLLDAKGEPERLDVMSRFLYDVCPTTTYLQTAIGTYPWPKIPLLPMIHVAEAYWLAGLYEGEGLFCIAGNTPRMVLQMTDRDVIAHAAFILGKNVWGGKVKTKNMKLWSTGVSGLTAIEWMRILLPYMGIRRQQQIQATVRTWMKRRECMARPDADWWLRMFNLKDRV